MPTPSKRSECKQQDTEGLVASNGFILEGDMPNPSKWNEAKRKVERKLGASNGHVSEGEDAVYSSSYSAADQEPDESCKSGDALNGDAPRCDRVPKRKFSIGPDLVQYETEKPDDDQCNQDGFSRALRNRLDELQSILVLEHDTYLRSLRTENAELRGRLQGAAGNSSAGIAEMQDPEDYFDTNENNILTDAWKPEILRSSTSKERQSQHQQFLKQESPVSMTSNETRRSNTNRLYQGGDDSKGSVHHAVNSHLALTQSDTFMMENGHHGLIERVVFSHTFDLLCASIIMANCILIAIEQQYTGIDNGHNIGVGHFNKPADQTWPGAEDVFLAFDLVFNACFCLELLLRLIALKSKAIFSGWIWFDTIIVVLGVVDIMSSITGGDTGGLGVDPTMVRVIRLVRVVRLFKIFKAMSQFDSLFLLIKAITASWIALVWSFLILGGVQIVVGLFLCQILQSYIENKDQPIEQRRKVFLYFGTFSRTMITMFEITLANWTPTCRLLIDNVSEWFIPFYIVYRCMFCFAIIRVIAAVFITETNRVLESDDELTVLKSTRSKKQYSEKLKSLFYAIDENHDGSFDFSELQEVMKHARTSSWLATLHFDIQDFEKVFWLLDDGSGRIHVDDFVGKVGQLKGQAKTIDMLTMLKLAHRIDMRLKKSLRYSTLST